MRTVCSVRWATCALAIATVPVATVPVATVPAAAIPIVAVSVSVSVAISVSAVAPAFADRPRRSLADCTRFDQTDQGDDRVAFTIRNACTIPLDCAVSWRLVCAPDTKKRRASHPGSVKFAIPDGASQSAEASAAVCGDDAWTIDSVQWTCLPNKD